MNEDMVWSALLPSDGIVEFPSMGNYTLRIRTRYDGYYECDVMHGDEFATSLLLTPDANVAICIRKTSEQVTSDEEKFLDKFARILGVETEAKP